MRATIAAVLALSLSACAPTATVWPPMPYADQASLPYADCGEMRALRANLTGGSEATPARDAILAKLGVRCVASYPPLAPAGAVR